MPLPTQAIFPGLLESAYRWELQNLFSKNALARLWAKGTSLWPAEDYQAESMESNLGWLDLPGSCGHCSPAWSPVLKMMGIHSPAHHFITLAEENSYLGQLPVEYDFLDSFLDPLGIHGRYSSLIHFNFFLAVLGWIQVTCSHARNRCAMPAVPLQGKQTLRYRSVRSWRRKSRAWTGWCSSPRAA